MRWKRGYHYRCRDYDCHTRVTLPHLLEWYKRKPKCKWCGSKKFKKDEFKHIDPFYRDRYRDNIEINVKPCQCDGYGHVAMRDPAPPHRIGSKCCEYRKDGTKRLPGDPDYHNPYAEEDSYENQQWHDLEMPEAPILEICPIDHPSNLEWQEAYFGRFGTGCDESVLCGNALGSSQEGNAGADCCRNP